MRSVRQSVFAITVLAAMLASSTAVAWSPCGADCDEMQPQAVAEGHECCPDSAPAEPDDSEAIHLATPDCCSPGCVVDSDPTVLDDEVDSARRTSERPAQVVTAELPAMPVRALTRPPPRPAPPPRTIPTETTRLQL